MLFVRAGILDGRPVWKTRPIALGMTLLAGSLLLVSVGLMVDGTSRGIWFNARFDLNPAMLTAWRYPARVNNFETHDHGVY